jgi:DNA repair exonuclease SbcCD ATPase subunit
MEKQSGKSCVEIGFYSVKGTFTIDIKSLTKIDFAFFDEPTSNLDIDKRRNLAGALSKVKGFRQLFVISHDDTFEQHASHVVRLSKNESAEEAQIDFEA